MPITSRSRIAIATLTVCIATTPAHAQKSDPYLERAKAILRTTPLVDGHNDLPWRIREDTLHANDIEAYDLRTHTPGMTDLARLKTGMVGAQFWSVYIPGEPDASDYKPNGKVSSTPGLRARAARADPARSAHDREVSRPPRLRHVRSRRPQGVRRAGRSVRCSAWKADTRSRTHSRCCAPTTTSARAT